MRGWNWIVRTSLAALALVAWGCGDDGTGIGDVGPIVGIDAGTGLPPGVDPEDVFRDFCGRPGAPEVGDSCRSDNDCDNGCFCDGLERCVEGTCAASDEEVCATGGDGGDVDCTEDTCFEELDRCFAQPVNERCSNGNACDGFEVCDTRLASPRCVSGVRLFCNDENSCTVDACNNEVGCVFTRRDLDGDGFLDGRCGGEDCEDNPASGGSLIFPGAREDCYNRRDDNCDGIRDFVDETCIPENDTCETGIELRDPGLVTASSPQKSWTYSGSTKALVGDYTLSCGRSGVDAVFHFTVPSGVFPDAGVDAVDLRVQVQGAVVAGLALRDRAECEGESTVDDKCAESGNMLRRSLPPGDYSLIVKTPAPATTFDLRIQFGPPTPQPQVDVCNGMTDAITASGSFEGFWEETRNDYRTSKCSFTPYNDVKDAAYRLVLTEESDVKITGSSENSTYGYDYLFITMATDCADTSKHFACNGQYSSTTLEKRRVPAGTYFIMLEPYWLDSTSYSIDVDITPSEEPLAGDACETAVDISSGSRTLSFTDLADDGLVSCGPVGYADAVFKFTLSDLQDVVVSTDAASTTYPSYRYNYTALLSECGLFSTSLACQYSSTTNTLRYRSLEPGTYYVAVGDYYGYMDSTTASVEISPPTPIPANDRCDGTLQEICDTPTGIFVDRTGTLTGFNNDIGSTGGECGYLGNDALYKCTLTSRKTVSVSATGSVSSYTGFYISYRTGGCPGSNVSSSCRGAFASSGTLSTSTTSTLDPGTYYFVVENYYPAFYGTVDDFTLISVVLDP